ncbi:MAG: transporter, family, nitrate/nitrite transporter [Streptosporangiaceae bacterium]|nr:transporter, family, nitrate/nitrite transporter [Streptosporangiaceae bacterium]
MTALADEETEAPAALRGAGHWIEGLGGGNFASSMANITHFYPVSRQGLPLGLNAAGGNLGTSVTQLAMPPLIVEPLPLPLPLPMPVMAKTNRNAARKAFQSLAFTATATAPTPRPIRKKSITVTRAPGLRPGGRRLGVDAARPAGRGGSILLHGQPDHGPAIFRTQALAGVNAADSEAVATATAKGRRDAAAAIGICSAVGALGGVLIQQASASPWNRPRASARRSPGSPSSTASVSC